MACVQASLSVSEKANDRSSSTTQRKFRKLHKIILNNVSPRKILTIVTRYRGKKQYKPNVDQHCMIPNIYWRQPRTKMCWQWSDVDVFHRLFLQYFMTFAVKSSAQNAERRRLIKQTNKHGFQFKASTVKRTLVRSFWKQSFLFTVMSLGWTSNIQAIWWLLPSGRINFIEHWQMMLQRAYALSSPLQKGQHK